MIPEHAPRLPRGAVVRGADRPQYRYGEPVETLQGVRVVGLFEPFRPFSPDRFVRFHVSEEGTPTAQETTVLLASGLRLPSGRLLPRVRVHISMIGDGVGARLIHQDGQTPHVHTGPRRSQENERTFPASLLDLYQSLALLIQGPTGETYRAFPDDPVGWPPHAVRNVYLHYTAFHARTPPAATPLLELMRIDADNTMTIIRDHTTFLQSRFQFAYLPRSREQAGFTPFP